MNRQRYSAPAHAAIAIAVLFGVTSLGLSPRTASAADDVLQSVRAMAAQCRADYKSGDDAAANQSCHTLERALATQLAPTAHALTAKRAAGKQLTRQEFFFELLYVSTERLVTNTMARVYYRVRSEHPQALHYGRQYAAQAIGWNLYDAANIHDLFEVAKHGEGAAPDTHDAREIQRELRASQVEDRKSPGQLEKMYPGVMAEALAAMHMTREKYDRIMATQ